MRRVAVSFVLFTVGVSTAGAAARDDPRYISENTRLARVVPHYPRARPLVQDNLDGEVGSARFEAVTRVYFLARPASQRAAIAFYLRKLGVRWRLRGDACLVSKSRLVIALVYPRTRRLGVLIDSRGARRCADEAALLGDLLDVNYPD